MMLRRYKRDDGGAATLEFGFVAVPLVMLIMGGIEIGVSLFLSAALEQGVIEASRYAVTGYTAGGVSREDRVLEILRRHTFGLAQIEAEDVSALIYPSFDDIGKPEPFSDANGNGSYDAGEMFNDVNGNGVWNDDMGTAGLGGPGDIVVYRVDYRWGFLTGIMTPLVGDITLASGIAVRNEPE